MSKSEVHAAVAAVTAAVTIVKSDLQLHIESLLNNETVTAETNDKRQKKMALSFLSSQVLKKRQYEITYPEVA